MFLLDVRGEATDQDHFEAVVQLMESFVAELPKHGIVGLFARLRGTDAEGSVVNLDLMIGSPVPPDAEHHH